MAHVPGEAVHETRHPTIGEVVVMYGARRLRTIRPPAKEITPQKTRGPIPPNYFLIVKEATPVDFHDHPNDWLALHIRNGRSVPQQ
jgi:hypothetical protein